MAIHANAPTIGIGRILVGAFHRQCQEFGWVGVFGFARLAFAVLLAAMAVGADARRAVSLRTGAVVGQVGGQHGCRVADLVLLTVGIAVCHPTQYITHAGQLGIGALLIGGDLLGQAFGGLAPYPGAAQKLKNLGELRIWRRRLGGVQRAVCFSGVCMLVCESILI